MENLTLTREQAAKLCSVSIPTITAWLNRSTNPIPHIRAGRKYLILASSLNEWLKAEAEKDI